MRTKIVYVKYVPKKQKILQLNVIVVSSGLTLYALAGQIKTKNIFGFARIAQKKIKIIDMLYHVHHSIKSQVCMKRNKFIITKPKFLFREFFQDQFIKFSQ